GRFLKGISQPQRYVRTQSILGTECQIMIRSVEKRIALIEPKARAISQIPTQSRPGLRQGNTGPHRVADVTNRSSAEGQFVIMRGLKVQPSPHIVCARRLRGKGQ